MTYYKYYFEVMPTGDWASCAADAFLAYASRRVGGNHNHTLAEIGVFIPCYRNFGRYPN